MPQYLLNVPVGPSPDQPNKRYPTYRQISECSFFIQFMCPDLQLIILSVEMGVVIQLADRTV
jgi:hypothetical protein